MCIRDRYFFASLKVSVTLAFVGTVISETVASNRGIGNVMTVSYTHLDVYKRQALCWAGTSNADTIKVGVVLPYSGPNSDLGNQVDKAFDLYVKLHAKDLGDNKIELVKRDEGPASGANARTVVTELITNDKAVSYTHLDVYKRQVPPPVYGTSIGSRFGE